MLFVAIYVYLLIMTSIYESIGTPDPYIRIAAIFGENFVFFHLYKKKFSGGWSKKNFQNFFFSVLMRELTFPHLFSVYKNFFKIKNFFL